MILRELYYTDRTIDNSDKDRYSPQRDQSPIKRGFTRRTRLTLKQINQARRADELHAYEKQEELIFVRQMYGIISQNQMSDQGGGDLGGF